jgi:hypothetical protein
MEIKLTTDWIFLQTTEVFINAEDKGCFRIFDGVFQYHLIEFSAPARNGTTYRFKTVPLQIYRI